MVKKEIIPIDTLLLNKACEIILKNYGLDFSGDKSKDLISALINSSKESGSKNHEHFTKLLIDNNLSEDELDILLKYLTVGETYFFRDEKLFSALQSKTAKDFFQKKSYINIWSAGCASGEEPYSIAILIDKLYGNNSDTKFNIFASDINKHSIEKAKKGLYRDWSFRSTPQWVTADYFSERKNGFYEISDSIKNKVEFALLNLSKIEEIKNNSVRYDVIICRNVLIYFSKPVAKNLLDTFYQKLNNEGIYITTASESINVNKNLFSKFIEGNNSIFIKKKFPLETSNKIAPPSIKSKKTESPVKKNISVKLESKKTVIKEELNLSQLYKKALTEYGKNNFADSLILFDNVEREINNGKVNLEDAAELYFYLVINNIKLGNHAKALKLNETYLVKYNLDYRLHYLHGILLQEEGEFNKAEEALKKSIYLNNKFPLSFFKLANLQLSAGKNSYKRNFEKSVKLLLDLQNDEIIKYSDGITAGNLIKQITLLLD